MKLDVADGRKSKAKEARPADNAESHPQGNGEVIGRAGKEGPVRVGQRAVKGARR